MNIRWIVYRSLGAVVLSMPMAGILAVCNWAYFGPDECQSISCPVAPEGCREWSRSTGWVYDCCSDVSQCLECATQIVYCSTTGQKPRNPDEQCGLGYNRIRADFGGEFKCSQTIPKRCNP